MSYQLEAPLARRDVRLDIADLYVFRGKEGTVFVLDVNRSLAEPIALQGFHPAAQYAIKLDLDDDAVEDLTYRLTFGEPAADGRQPILARRLSGREASNPSATGTTIVEGSTGDILRGMSGSHVWAGRAADPFYADLAVLNAVSDAFKNGTRVDLGRWKPANALNRLAGATINAIVLEVPDTELSWRLREVPVEPFNGEFTWRLRPNKRIGVWATTMLPNETGKWQAINRVGHPMIRSIFHPDESEEANRYNTTVPADDVALYGERFARSIAAVVAAYGTASSPQSYGEMVASLLLPDMLPYQLGTPACYGFAGHNGRALTDNVPDVMFSLVTNAALSGGITAASMTVASMAANLRDTFPYLALPED